MGPREVGVEVDHLRLHPQPELHAEPAHSVDQRMQAVRPDPLVDVPVAQPGRVVTAVAEPAVVEHVALRADLRGEPGELGQPAEVVVEVDGLPGVAHHRSRPARMVRAGAQVGVEAGGDAVEPDAVRPVDPRPGVALPRRQGDLAGQQQLPAAEHRVTRAEPLGVGDVVAAPRHVHGPDLAVPRVEPGGAGRKDQRGVRSGPPAPVLPRVHADDEGQPLRGPLAAPAAGEVEQLRRDRRHGQRQRQAVDGVGPVRGRGDRAPLAHQAGREQLDLEPHLKTRDGVGTGGDDAPARQLEPGQGEERRPALTGAGPGEPGPPVPARRVLGQHCGRPVGLVEVVGDGGGPSGGRERGEVGRGHVAEVVPPVQHRG